MEEKLIPVLQMDDIKALEAARKHLEENGFKADIGSFSDLPEGDLQDWMIPENGGWMFYLEEAKYEAAMNMLGDFFGYTADGE
ncbi:MAG: hypothetical protein KAR44_14550 [Candidatus Aegiribacteria sp.]|nr:hypothetical protein [Candidatus Aegiribacteria sp.]